MVISATISVFFTMASLTAALMPMPSARVTFPRPTLNTHSGKSRLFSTVLEPTATSSDVATKSSATGERTTWDCDEDANCVQVPACNDEKCRTSLDVRIHGTWYDLSGWRKAHPAGTHWIDWYDGRDATEVMDGFHSGKGRAMYQRLPKSKPDAKAALDAVVGPDSSISLAFRGLRQELEDEGWWKRDMAHEFAQLGIWAGLVVGAVLTAQTLPPVSMLLLGIAMTAAGWLGHDYIHGVDEFSDRMRNFACYAGGLSPTWWSDKHNKHHALTNEMGVDEDIATDPFLFPWVPDPSQDSPLRKIQHWIFFIPFSALFALWRVDSVTVVVNAIEQKRPEAKTEMYGLLAHYLILLSIFPIGVWLPAIFFSGLLTALIVTPTHQSEEMFEDYQDDWVSAQFRSTRNAVMTNPFSEWLWGGMQYQLEHHLFPSMPRNRYPQLREKLIAFASANQVPGGYRESGEFEILKMNWDLYRKVAEADAIPGAPLSRGRIGQQGAIRESSSPAAASIKKS